MGSDLSEVEHLAGRQQITDITRFSERTPGACFIVIREYECCDELCRPNPLGQLPVADETIYFVSEPLCLALNEFQTGHTPSKDAIFDIQPREEIRNLHYWLYHHQKALNRFASVFGKDCPDLACFGSYVESSKHDEYGEVSDLIRHGKITMACLRYLFVSFLSTFILDLC